MSKNPLFNQLTLSERVIVALDVDTADQARSIVDMLKDEVDCFKVGLQLMMAIGAPAAIALVHEHSRVFLDAKLHDIPNTVAQAVKQAVGHGAAIINLHVSAHMEAMQAAVEAASGHEIWGVTVLTSLDEDDTQAVYGAPTKTTVLKFARNAALAGLSGLICSSQEATAVRRHHELDRLSINTPGIRPDWAAAGDQKRVLTPTDAIRAGADRLIIGRPITNPPEDIGGSVEALYRIFEEAKVAFAERGIVY